MSKKEKSDLDKILGGIATAYNIAEIAVAVGVVGYMLWEGWKEYKENIHRENMHQLANKISVLMFDAQFADLNESQKSVFERKFSFIIGCLVEKHGDKAKKSAFLRDNGAGFCTLINNEGKDMFKKNFSQMSDREHSAVWEKIKKDEFREAVIAWLIKGMGWGIVVLLIFWIANP